jgi:hypothetical protein
MVRIFLLASLTYLTLDARAQAPCAGRCVLLSSGAMTWATLSAEATAGSRASDTRLDHDFGLIEAPTFAELRTACAGLAKRRAAKIWWLSPYPHEVRLELVDDLQLDLSDRRNAVLRRSTKFGCE